MCTRHDVGTMVVQFHNQKKKKKSRRNASSMLDPTPRLQVLGAYRRRTLEMSIVSMAKRRKRSRRSMAASLAFAIPAPLFPARF